MAADAQVIKSISEYLDAVADFPDDRLLLRGQRVASWFLAPSVSRLDARDGGNGLALERQLITDFKRDAFPHLVREPRDDWDWLAVAQHAGLATRLLDWTTNPLAALWFAVREPAVEGGPGAVYAITVEDGDLADRSVSPFKATSTKFFQPSHLSPRIIAQGGWFSAHSWVSRKGRFTRLANLGTYRDRIQAFHFPAGTFGDLRWMLDRLGVNHATMFPDVDGISKNVNWSHALLSDEVP